MALLFVLLDNTSFRKPGELVKHCIQLQMTKAYSPKGNDI